MKRTERLLGDLSAFAVLDLDRIWPYEILPLIDSQPKLRALHTRSIREWCGRYWNTDELATTYTERTHGGAWQFSTSDYWCTHIDKMIEEAAYEHHNEDAQAYLAFRDAASHASDGKLLSGSAKNELLEAVKRLRQQFEPNRKEARYWTPCPACHTVTPWCRALAKAWKPKGNWRLIKGDQHSTVVDLKDRLIFDLSLFNNMPTNTSEDILRFILKGDADRVAWLTQGAPQLRAA